MSTSPIAEGIEAMTISSEYGAGDRAGEIYQRLLRERIVFLGTQVDQTSANLICAQLLLLEAEDRERDISLYVNSPGGSVTPRSWAKRVRTAPDTIYIQAAPKAQAKVTRRSVLRRSGSGSRPGSIDAGPYPSDSKIADRKSSLGSLIAAPPKA